MKRKQNLIFRILTALMAALLLASCGAAPKETTTEEETEDPNVGRYYIGAAEVEGRGVELNDENVENIFLRLKDDGKAVLQMNPSDDAKYNGSWKVKKDTLTLKLDSDDFDEDEYTGSIEDGIIDIKIDGVHMVFVKGKSAAKEYAKAHPPVVATTEEPTTAEPTTEAPTEPSTQQPETTQSSVSYSIYYILYWNNWAPEKADLENNYIAFPNDGSDATIVLGSERAKAQWKLSGSKLTMTINGTEYDTIFDDPMITIDADDLKAYFVFGPSIAAGEWDRLYGVVEPTEPETTGNASGDLAIQEQVVMNRGGIKVTAKGIVNDKYEGLSISFEVENTTDKDIYVGSGAVAVNGAMIRETFYCHAEPGKTGTDILPLDEEWLDLYSIKTIGSVDLRFYVVDRSDYSTMFEEDKDVRIKTNYFGSEDKPQMPEKALKLYEGEGITAYFVTLGINDYEDMYSRLYIENKTDRTVVIDADEALLNDIEVDNWFYETVAPGCVCIGDMEYEDDSLEENGFTKNLDELNSASFKLVGYDADTYDDIFEADLMRVNFK